jgi:hypothetical protein
VGASGDPYRSGFERALAGALRVLFEYEQESFRLTVAVARHSCRSCGSKEIIRHVSYTPDFFFKTGWIIEAKGKFTPRDRKLALAFTEQYPTLKYGLCFQRDNRLTKSSKTRYSEWCEKHGIPYSVGAFKTKWVA